MNPRTTASCCVLFVALVMPAAASAQGARVQLDHLNRLAEKSTETVDVTVDSATLKETAGFLAGKGSDSEKVQEVMQGINGIYVKSFKFDGPNMYSDADVETIRKQAAGSGWTRVVGVKGKGELTEIYFWKGKDENGGLLVISAESQELTVVNIVGRVDLASLAALGPVIPKLPGGMRKPR